MTEWVLVIMLCQRFCTPIQAEVYYTKAECTQHITDAGGFFSIPKQYCIPLIRNK